MTRTKILKNRALDKSNKARKLKVWMNKLEQGLEGNSFFHLHQHFS